MRVAIVHYWLVNMRGGERVVEALCEIFPQADIFTHAYCPARVSPRINCHNVKTSFIGRLPLAEKFYKAYLPLMPLALEQLDLREYDLVISSESGPAKGVLTGSGALHLCYCHTPMRYVWSMYLDYARNAGSIARIALPWFIHKLRIWDACSAARVDFFIANSRNVARQIRKFYGRPSVIVHPPVEVDSFAPSERILGYYLCVGQLVRYKRFDLAIEAFNALRLPLVIIGEGAEYRALQRLAGPTITFLGRQNGAALRQHYSHCRALIFPGEEDFGIVPLEAMASGRPVIAYGRGGALETVLPGKTGILFNEATPAALIEAVREFDAAADSFSPSQLVEFARGFSTDKFKAGFLDALRQAAEGCGIDLPLGEPRAATVVSRAGPPAFVTPEPVPAVGT